jgi:hypothetical protein
MGIEPTSEAWEASILPLYDARSFFFSFSIIHNCALASTDRDGHFRISNCSPEVCPVIRIENRMVFTPSTGRASNSRQRHPRDLTPDHRTDIASKVNLASQ